MEISVRNVNEAFELGTIYFEKLAANNMWEPSRAGEYIPCPEPFITKYRQPFERVLWDARRDCNPFFHLFESLWMLAGSNDVAYLTTYNQKMGDFSDNGVTYNGAYGERWRYHFGYDQLEECVEMLRRDTNTRRCLMQMWSAEDLRKTSKDLPCNIAIKFEIRNSMLNMQVFNRSNDMILGAYGANAVHMAFLQEYVARCVGIPIGTYWQISGNFHIYKETWNSKVRENFEFDVDLYPEQKVFAMSLAEGCAHPRENLFPQIHGYVMHGLVRGTNTFLQEICEPLDDVWSHWKAKDRAKALLTLQNIPYQNNDWVTACRLWMERRITK